MREDNVSAAAAPSGSHCCLCVGRCAGHPVLPSQPVVRRFRSPDDPPLRSCCSSARRRDARPLQSVRRGIGSRPRHARPRSRRAPTRPLAPADSKPTPALRRHLDAPVADPARRPEGRAAPQRRRPPRASSPNRGARNGAEEAEEGAPRDDEDEGEACRTAGSALPSFGLPTTLRRLASSLAPQARLGEPASTPIALLAAAVVLLAASGAGGLVVAVSTRRLLRTP